MPWFLWYSIILIFLLQASLYQSPSEIRVFIHLSGATCFSQVTLSSGPSPLFFWLLLCVLWKLPMFILRLNLFYLNLFPCFLPPGRANTSTRYGNSSSQTPEIYPFPLFLMPPSSSKPVPSLSCTPQSPPNWSPQFHPGQPTIHSPTKPISDVNTPIPYFQSFTDFQLLTTKLMVWKAYGAWLLPP